MKRKPDDISKEKLYYRYSDNFNEYWSGQAEPLRLKQEKGKAAPIVRLKQKIVGIDKFL